MCRSSWVFCATFSLFGGVACETINLFGITSPSSVSTDAPKPTASPFWFTSATGTSSDASSPRWPSVDIASAPSQRRPATPSRAQRAGTSAQPDRPHPQASVPRDDDDSESLFGRSGAASRHDAAQGNLLDEIVRICIQTAGIVEDYLRSMVAVVTYSGHLVYQLHLPDAVFRYVHIAIGWAETPFDHYLGLLPEELIGRIVAAVAPCNAHTHAIWVVHQCAIHMLLIVVVVWIWLGVWGAWLHHRYLSFGTVLLIVVSCGTFPLLALITTFADTDPTSR